MKKFKKVFLVSSKKNIGINNQFYDLKDALKLDYTINKLLELYDFENSNSKSISKKS